MSEAIQNQTNGSDEIVSAFDIARELRCSKAHVYSVFLGRVARVTSLPVTIMGPRRLVRRSLFELWTRSNELRELGKLWSFPLTRLSSCSARKLL
jgi:hypothetical protein